jgi:acyl-coenzyme A synthetase/AMP-(fatty) acid ligase
MCTTPFSTMPIRAVWRWALDPGVKYWCTADPGWVTGTSYGIISPLVNRVSMLIDEAEFDLERWYGRFRTRRSRSGIPRPPRSA